MIPTQGGVRWQQALALFADSKQKELGKKFVQYILSPEGQGKLATSSCYWGMPANSKAVLERRAEGDPALERPAGLHQGFASLPADDARVRQGAAGVCGPRCCRRSDGVCRTRRVRLPKRASPASASPCRRLPGSLLFFGAPLVIMAVMSLLPLTADGAPPLSSLKAYSDFFGQPAYVQAIWNSVVTTAIVVADLAAARPILRLCAGLQGAEALAAFRARLRDPAVLDLLCRALLCLAAGPGADRNRQLDADQSLA